MLRGGGVRARRRACLRTAGVRGGGHGRIRRDLRRHDTAGLGRRPGILAGRACGDRRRNQRRNAAEGEHFPCLAWRHDAGLRADTPVPYRHAQPGGQQRRPVPQLAVARGGPLGDEGLSGGHRRGRHVHRTDLRRAGARVSRATGPSRARRRRWPDTRARVGGHARNGEGVHQEGRLERPAGRRARQRHPGARERPRDQPAGGRRRATVQRRPARPATARRRAHEDRVPEHPPEGPESRRDPSARGLADRRRQSTAHRLAGGGGATVDPQRQRHPAALEDHARQRAAGNALALARARRGSGRHA